MQTELPAGSVVHPASTRSFAKQPALQRPQTSLFTVPEGHNLRPLCVNRRSYYPLVATSTGLPLVGVRGLVYLDSKEIPFALATQGTHSPPSVAYALPCGHTLRQAPTRASPANRLDALTVRLRSRSKQIGFFVLRKNGDSRVLSIQTILLPSPRRLPGIRHPVPSDPHISPRT